MDNVNIDKAIDIINTVDDTDIKPDPDDNVNISSDDVINAAKDIKKRMDSINNKCSDNINNTDCNNKPNDNNSNDNGTKDIDYSKLTPREISNITGTNNLKPLNTRTKEEQKRIATLGGKKSGEIRRARKSAKELLEKLLSTNMSQDMIDDVLGSSSKLLGDDKTAYNVMLTKMIQVACAGDTKAFIALRDTVGDKPADKQEITADIMSDADRSMVDKLKKRIINNAPSDS